MKKKLSTKPIVDKIIIIIIIIIIIRVRIIIINDMLIEKSKFLSNNPKFLH
jgi:hypothetical protein